MKHRPTEFNRQSSILRRKLPQDVARELDLDSPIIRGLNPAQRTAVTTPSKVVQILAPPGSGKTRTLTSRVAYILSEPLNLDPQNVIVATFTVKAANEMKERLSNLVGEGVERRLLLGTFHSICRRYLLKYGHLIGLHQGWGIADTGDSKAICSRIIKRRGLSDAIDPRQLQSRISHFKARNLSPRANTFPIVHSSNPSTQQTQKKQKDIATDDFVMLYEDYHATLKSSNLLDYDDLLLRCLKLLKEKPQCVSNIEAVLIDEFQDTNIVQYELMRNFASAQQRITVVGDPDQSIYGFRAAEIGNVRRMHRHYPDILIVNLEENYRSSASILQAALVVIQQDSQRISKTLTATHPIGPSPVLRRVPSAALEAEWIVCEIKRLQAVTAGMLTLDGIAVLVRSAHLTRRVETSLTRQGLVYKMVGGTRFFDRAEVKTVVDYLRVFQNPANNDALSRIINVPPRKIGETTVKGLLEHAEGNRRSLWDSVCGAVRGHAAWGVKVAKPAERGLESFVGLMVRAMAKLDDPEMTLADIVEILLSKLGYAAYLKKEYPDDSDGRWANTEELVIQAREVRFDDDDEALPEIEGIEQQLGSQRTPRAALERFLANAALVNERQSETLKEKVAEITISTIHAAKGLEWPVVFVPAVYEGSIPHSRAEDVDEERRLLYVAMTRAQALLYLSCPFRSSSTDKVKLSPFVDTPAVTRLLRDRASDLSFSQVQTLAQILSARCPTEIDIEAAIERSGIPSRSDDHIPDKDPSNKEVGDGPSNPNAEYQFEKNSEGRFNGNVPQFQSARGWSNDGTTEDHIRRQMTTVDKIGFRTANNHFSQLQKQGNITCEADKVLNERRMAHDRIMGSGATVMTNVKKASILRPAAELADVPKPITHGRKTNGAIGSIKRPAGQGTLLGFFTKKPSKVTSQIETSTVVDKPKTATEVVRSTNSLDMTLKEQMEFLPAPIIPKRAGEIFILLSSSPPRRIKKVKVNPGQQEQPKKMDHVDDAREPLLQADLNQQDDIAYEPPSSPAFKIFCQAIDEDDPPVVGEYGGTIDSECCQLGDGVLPELKQEIKVPSVDNNFGMPSPANYHGHPVRGRKRTLGIRRSLNGWQNRGSKRAR